MIMIDRCGTVHSFQKHCKRCSFKGVARRCANFSNIVISGGDIFSHNLNMIVIMSILIVLNVGQIGRPTDQDEVFNVCDPM